MGFLLSRKVSGEACLLDWQFRRDLLGIARVNGNGVGRQRSGRMNDEGRRRKSRIVRSSQARAVFHERGSARQGCKPGGQGSRTNVRARYGKAIGKNQIAPQQLQVVFRVALGRSGCQDDQEWQRTIFQGKILCQVLVTRRLLQVERRREKAKTRPTQRQELGFGNNIIRVKVSSRGGASLAWIVGPCVCGWVDLGCFTWLCSA